MSRLTFLEQYLPEDAPERPRLKRHTKIKPEDALQIACVDMLRARKDLRFIVAQPDRIQRPSMWYRGFLARLGVFGNTGHVEIIVLPSDPMDTTLIELKSQDGRLTDEQKQWQLWTMARGYRHVVVRRVEEMEAILHRLK